MIYTSHFYPPYKSKSKKDYSTIDQNDLIHRDYFLTQKNTQLFDIFKSNRLDFV